MKFSLTWFQDPIFNGIIIGTIISTIPLLIYIALKTPEDDGAWLGPFGVFIVMLLRELKK